MNSAKQINKMCLSAMLLAIGWVLPLITGQIPEIGNMLCPMHFPVLLCGFILGPWYGLGLGFLLPISRNLLFGAPPIFPMAISMSFELATYGLCSGFLWRLFKKNNVVSVFITLLIAMICGRFIWGVSRYFCGLISKNFFTFQLFLSGAFITAWPGILLQFIFIPALLYILKRTQVLEKYA